MHRQHAGNDRNIDAGAAHPLDITLVKIVSLKKN
jgi:hypothetical protein